MSDKKKLSTVLAELKSEYLLILPHKIELLKKLTTEKNWKDLSEEYHKLKGTGKTYGYPEISTVSEILESLASQKSGHNAILFNDAIFLFERILNSYKKNEPFPLNNDIFAKNLLSLKAK